MVEIGTTTTIEIKIIVKIVKTKIVKIEIKIEINTTKIAILMKTINPIVAMIDHVTLALTITNVPTIIVPMVVI